MAEMKDRHSRMAYSTVRAPPKKNGKGGKYTWGADDDVTDYCYLPVGPGGGYVAVATVPVSSPHAVAAGQPGGGFSPVRRRRSTRHVVDSLAFPPLGASTLPSPVFWGPHSTSGPKSPAPAKSPPKNPAPAPERVQPREPEPLEWQAKADVPPATLPPATVPPPNPFQSRQPLCRVAIAETKDRHSRMAYSTVRAPPKKNGKGGKFTWGADDDVTDYYLPVGPGGGYVAVATSPVGTQQVGSPHPVAAAQPRGSYSSAMDSSAFPPLGTAVLSATVSWGPSRSASEPASPPTTPELVPSRAPGPFDRQAAVLRSQQPMYRAAMLAQHVVPKQIAVM